MFKSLGFIFLVSLLGGGMISEFIRIKTGKELNSIIFTLIIFIVISVGTYIYRLVKNYSQHKKNKFNEELLDK